MTVENIKNLCSAFFELPLTIIHDVDSINFKICCLAKSNIYIYYGANQKQIEEILLKEYNELDKVYKAHKLHRIKNILSGIET